MKKLTLIVFINTVVLITLLIGGSTKVLALTTTPGFTCNIVDNGCVVDQSQCALGTHPICSTIPIDKCLGLDNENRPCISNAITPTNPSECGYENGPCCANNVCNDPTVFTCKYNTQAQGNLCEANITFVQTCGTEGLPCCSPGQTCEPGLSCSAPSQIGVRFCVSQNSIYTNTNSSVTCTPTGGTADSGIKTAIGCIPVLNNDNGTAFMAFILRWAVGVGGGIAFLLILYAGFMVMTSAGNPERLKAGQELLTSAISGLILLIFSVFILKFIGIDILRLCMFGFGGPCPTP